MNIYFATNRNPLPAHNEVAGFGTSFNPHGAAVLRFGVAHVSGEQIDLEVNPDPSDGVTVEPGSVGVYSRLRANMLQGGPDTLVFVHGYNQSFADAIRMAAAMAAAYGENGPLNAILFSWPSDGSLVLPAGVKAQSAYFSDQAEAKASGVAFARFVAKGIDFLRSVQGEKCNKRLHLVAHSMGAYVVRHGVNDLASFIPGLFPCIFSNGILTAADEDHDSLEFIHKLARLPELCASTSVYFNKKDAALLTSENFKNPMTRLGTTGPKHPFDLPAGVSAVDVAPWPSLIDSHTYHLGTPLVVSDIKSILAGTEPETLAQEGRRHFVSSRNHWVLK